MINYSGGFSSGNQQEKPQENQFMGNTPSNPQNNTGWMAPATPESNYSETGAQAPQQQQQAPAQAPQVSGGSSDGTALSSAINGSWHQPYQQQQAPGQVGQYMPEGYDTSKFSDTAGANSTKYQVGRILSKYPPGPAGLQQAAGELSRLGISVSGRDRITLPDGTTTDVGKSFSDPNAQHAWQYNWSGPAGGDGGGNMQQGGSMLGQQNQQQGFQGGMNPQMITQYLQQYMPGGAANQFQPQVQRPSYNFSNYNPNMATSQGDMMGGPMDQLTGGGSNYLPSGSMGIRAPGPDNPFANNPNVRF